MDGKWLFKPVEMTETPQTRILGNKHMAAVMLTPSALPHTHTQSKTFTYTDLFWFSPLRHRFKFCSFITDPRESLSADIRFAWQWLCLTCGACMRGRFFSLIKKQKELQQPRVSQGAWCCPKVRNSEHRVLTFSIYLVVPYQPLLPRVPKQAWLRLLWLSSHCRAHKQLC